MNFMQLYRYFKSYFTKTFFVKGWLVMLLFISYGCNDFLSETPDNRVALDNLEKAAQVLTNAYSLASPAFTDWMSDDVNWTRGTNVRMHHLQTYLWEDVTSDPTNQDTPQFFWFQTYDAIAHANEVLNIVDNLSVDTEEDEARKKAVESEALLTRAYGHFMLVNLFAKHFNVQTARSDMGIPYVDQPETVFIGTYERQSVKRVYDKIEDDLLDGLKLLDESFFANSGKYHFNRNAALAFASRFYLFKRDYIRCLQYSDELLGADASVYVRDFTSEEFQNASSSTQEYPQLYSSPDMPANLLLIRKISLVQRTDFAFGPSSNFYSSLFATRPFANTTDERENPALVKGENALFPSRYQSLFERSSLNSNTGFPYHIALSFRGEEVLLNRVEANVIENNLDEALADLQILSNRRYSGQPPILTMGLLRTFYGADTNPITDQLILLNYVLLERRKEFIAQGMRWFDIKRYEISVTHNIATGNTVNLEQNDLRKVLQIPASAVDVGGLKPNPR